MEVKRKTCYVLFALLILLNVYDTYSTHILLNSGMDFYEFNPLLAFSMQVLGQTESMVLLKGILVLWITTFLFRAKTSYEWNILAAGLTLIVSYYAAGMYFLNYKAMLFLGGVL